MKGNKHPTNDITINPSGNESILDVIARANESRRDFLKSALSLSVTAAPLPPVRPSAPCKFLRECIRC